MVATSAYRIREVDGDDEEETLAGLHTRTFDASCPHGDYGDGFWWLAFFEDAPVAFGGICESTLSSDYGYFSRVGVLRAHRGNALQLRLMRAMDAKARRQGWTKMITDTTNTNWSANNIITAGYRLWDPPKLYAFPNTLYWIKDL